MMVEKSPQIEGMGHLMVDLADATQKLESIHRNLPQTLSKSELDELTRILQQLDNSFPPASMGDKSFAFEGMNDKIAKVLLAIQLIHTQDPQKTIAHRRNVEQAITSLVSSLNSALEKSDKNTRDLRKYKIGQRVEKVSKSKETGKEDV